MDSIINNIIEQENKVSIREFEKSCKRIMCGLYRYKDSWRVRDSIPEGYSESIEDLLSLDQKFVVQEWENCIDNELKMKFIEKNKQAIIKLFK